MKTLADLREKLSAPAERYAEYLDSQYSDGAVEEFTIDDQAKADWALRKLRELKQEKGRNKEFAEREKAKIDAWLEEVNGQLDRDIEYFEGLLLAYAERLRQQDPKFKSLRLPNGRFGFRKQPAKWHCAEKRLLELLKENGRSDLIRTKEEVDKQALKKQFEVVDGRVIDPETGWIVEGVTVEEIGEKLKIEVSE